MARALWLPAYSDERVAPTGVAPTDAWFEGICKVVTYVDELRDRPASGGLTRQDPSLPATGRTTTPLA
ncbi:hypothetical protein ACFWIJ_16210 [Streptomyces sp. NPDC127079]|uniref:hypothetical protein n=1 Tax=Streptomyces sp. NPDC127079 TaxID=3347132 RepID=UPI00366835B0